MADTGFVLPTGYTDWADLDAVWFAPEEILTDNAANASCPVSSLAPNGNHLCASVYGFSLPTDATIDGIEVEVDKAVHNTISIEGYLNLTKNNINTVGTTKNLVEPSGIATYGGPSDLWGTTWTKAEIESNNFGAVLSCVWVGGVSPEIAVDYVKIKVYYTGTAGPAPTYMLPAQRRGR